MKLLLFVVMIFPAFTFGQNVSVKTGLAALVESAVKNTNIDVNIPPNKAVDTSLEISKVNGLSVCSPEAEKYVKDLQSEFVKSDSLRLTYSIYGAYLNTDGGIKYLPPNSENIKELIGECTNIYVSVY